MKKKRIISIIIIALVCFIAPGFYNRLKIQLYSMDVEELKQPVRIALVTDLHSCRYGEKEQILVDAIDSQNPDVILLGGDIFDDKISDDNTEAFLAGVADRYPCYYVTGNHEYWSGSSAFADKMAILDKYGITRLSGEIETITINGESVNICGVDDPDAYMIVKNDSVPDTPVFSDQLDNLKDQIRSDNYTILLSHRPEFLSLYAEYGFDLVLSGHAHGGQWRIPGVLNGLYAPNQGLFPQYAGGMYKESNTTMIVSRGLARESTRVPRFYDRPELVIVDLL